MKNNKQAQVFHFDVFGKRQDKYDFLEKHSIDDINWNELQPEDPNYFLVTKNFDGSGEYEKGFKLDSFFIIYNTGIETGRDDFFIDFDLKSLQGKIEKVFNNKQNSTVLQEFKITDTSSFRFKENLMKSSLDVGKFKRILYRPFDFRFTYYDTNIQRRPSFNTLKHLLNENLALSTCRQQSTFDFQHILITNIIIERCTVSLQTKETGYIFPLYLYPETKAQQTIGQTTERTPNLNMEIVKQLAEKLCLNFVPEKEPEGNVCFVNNAEVRPDFKTTFAPINILDYIYAILHSPTYREKYKEFLKIDFPRVPYPKDAETFWQLVELGGKIRQIHLLESQKVNQFITSYPEDGNNEVTRKMTTASPGWEATNEENTIGRVWINDQQYFDGVPLIAWEFYIGGYQPAQKWLKDRHGRILNFEDIIHYQKIIVALTETHRLMKEVDNVGVE